MLQDPYICLNIGDWSETTDTLANAGANATWADLDMLAEVNPDLLGKEKLMVRVMDENTTRKDSVLGVGSVTMRKLCSRINSAVELSVALMAENGTAVGTVLITATLSQCRLEDLVDALPESAVTVKAGLLKVTKITALDLKGNAFTFLGDKQDPYVLLEMENDWSAKTEVRQNAGRKALWEHLNDIELTVDTDILKFKRITVSVLDKNVFAKDGWMGRGDFSLRKLGSTKGTVSVTHLVRLKDKRGKAAGRVLLEAEIHPLPEVLAGPEADPAFLQTMGRLHIADCSAANLANSGMLGKQDLYVKFAVADWKAKSEGTI
jgi:Ca2+-dependent lipid-binding protein